MNRIKVFLKTLIAVLTIACIAAMFVACNRNEKNGNENDTYTNLTDGLVGVYKSSDSEGWFKLDVDGWSTSDGKSGTLSFKNGIVTCYDGDTVVYNATITDNSLSVVSVDTGNILYYLKNAAEHEHEFSEWEIITEPDCTNTGIKRRTCFVCGGEQDEEISALGHNYETVAGITPTCINPGNVEYRKCLRCGLNFAADSDTVIYETGLPSVKHNFVDGTCTVCGADKNAADKYIRVGKNGMPDPNGEYILFGTYPQTKISDANLVGTLNSEVGELPAANASRYWTSYSYFISDEIQDYMWYKDLTYDDEKYRAVYFKSYRPYYISYESGENNSNQDDNGYFIENIYWFKFEPLKWRIATTDGSSAVLICESVIDSREFYTSVKSHNINMGALTYANNWEYSSVREWLNSSFYNTAFSTIQKKVIIPTDVDNKTTAFDSKENEYAVKQRNTWDNVYLLGYKEILDLSYTQNNVGYADAAKTKKATDYAKAQGLYVSSNGNSVWWLRSAHNDSDSKVSQVDYNGIVYAEYSVHHTSSGIAPVLKLRICPNHYPDSDCYCSECGQTEHNLSTRCVCSQCGKTVHTVHDCVCIVCGTAVHSLVRIAPVAETCETNGNDEYWECSECKKLFSDAGGGTEIKSVPVIKALKHNVENCVCTRCNKVLHNFVNCVCTVCKTTDHDMEDCKCLKCGTVKHIGIGEYCRHGDILYFGEYPQTMVTDSVLRSKLNALGGNLPTGGYSQAWTPYSYYLNGNKATNYMWYIDIEYDNAKYRGVYYISYRPKDVKGGNTPEDSNQDDNAYIKNTVFWFTYEPIKWRILSEESGEVLLLCDSALDSFEYYANIISRDVNPVDWESSTAREWLNDTFYNFAFTRKQQAIIEEVRLNNKTSAQSGSGNEYATVQNDTTDRFFYLSYSELMRNDYGFSANVADKSRIVTPTDYAKSLGASSVWAMRSPKDESHISVVDGAGGTEASRAVSDTSVGVVPAVWIRLCDYHTPNADCICTKCGETEHELQGGVCIRCGRVVFTRVDFNGKQDPDGEYLHFGTYPQTAVTESSLLASLNLLAGTIPTAENNRKWTPYGYYVRNSVSNYMWYIDIEKDGEKYRGVYFIGYRPSSTTFNSSADTSDMNENGYLPSKTYWFKFEDIKWKILSEDDGSVLIYAVNMIDSREYQALYREIEGTYYTTYGSAPEGTLANSWEYSTIREWLNTNFYEDAFGVFQRKLIETTYNSDVKAYDKIYLLSTEEVNDPLNGFTEDLNDDDKALIKGATDYAKAQGLYIFNNISKEVISGQWWLRSANERTSYAYRIGLLGGLVPDDVTYTNVGIVPAMRIIACDGHVTENCVCVKCGQSVHNMDENCVCRDCGKEGHIVTNCHCILCGKEIHSPENCVCRYCGLTAHVIIKHEREEALCETTGKLEYYECADCGKIFANERATIELKDYIISATGHMAGDDGVCVLCGKTQVGIYQRVNKYGVPDAKGEYIFFGTYPQSEVIDMEIIETLNTECGELPEETSLNGWTLYGFHANGVASENAWFKDIEKDGHKYRGVYFEDYRSVYSNKASNEIGNQKLNGYETEKIYWFTYEPLKWRILEEMNGTVVLLSEYGIDSREFNSTIKDNSNDWASSDLRDYLNNDFVEGAFGVLQKELLAETELNNSDTSSVENNSGYASTTDKVYLLSYKDIVNPAYGFGTNIKLSDSAKIKTNTQYAYAMGAYMTENGVTGGGLWLLRSNSGDDSVSGITAEGRVDDYYVFGVYYTGYGIVPVVKINLCKEHEFENCVCTVCGSYKHNTVYVPAVEEGCTENGNIAHWHCEDCGKNFLDENGLQLAEDIMVYAKGHNYVRNVCTICRKEATLREKYWRVNSNNEISNIGTYIYFGEYPQTIKDAAVRITDTMDRRGYYLGTDGEYYAKVIATPFGDYKFSTNAEIEKGRPYYFKVEPLKWRIVNESTDYVVLVCESIIENMSYDAFASGYEASAVRAWLNETFYENAFNSYQKSLIQDTLVTNGASTTLSDNNPNAGNATSDKIYLLSYSELINSGYGYSDDKIDVSEESYGVYFRTKGVSDYCLANGCYADDSGNGWWWTRSPYYENSNSVTCIQPNGDVYDYRGIDKNNTGIVPAVMLKLQ